MSRRRWSSIMACPTFAIKGEDNETYYQHILSALDFKPNFTMDDGADTVGIMHTERRELIENIIGGTEETTTGVIRLRAMAKDGVLEYPDRRRQRRATPSTSSTIATARARARWTASCARPMS